MPITTYVLENFLPAHKGLDFGSGTGPVISSMLLIMNLLYYDTIDFKSWHYRKYPTHVFIYRKETIAYIANAYKLDIVVVTDRFIVFKKTGNNNV